MRHSSYLEVNLSFLGENVQSIKNLAPRAELIPMVKANAYGNGLVPISQHLVREHGVKKLGCASLGEALKVFQESPDLPVEMLVFSDSEIQNPNIREAYTHLNITPVIHQPADLEIILSHSEFKRVPLVIKLNTGMNRLGLTWEELEPFVPRLKNRGIEHLMTHFACSYFILKDGDKTHRQMDEFRRIKKNLQDGGVEVRSTSVSNSGAIEQKFGVDETYIRPGLIVYGPPAVLEPQQLWFGNQSSRLITKIMKTFHAKKGTPIGYGINVLPQDAFMAIIPIGYADGLVTFASGLELNIKGLKAKLFARINMDMAFLMFDPAAESKIKVEDQIEIWNHDNRVITDIATQMKTIPYQVMCAISDRIPRIYKVK
jgi:alanine racemase